MLKYYNKRQNLVIRLQYLLPTATLYRTEFISFTRPGYKYRYIELFSSAPAGTMVA